MGGAHLEELGEGDVVESVRAVEDHTLLGHGLGQVLRRLRLARAGGSFRGAACESVVKLRLASSESPGFPSINRLH